MKTDWNKIVEEAFESNETHVFSEKYCRRRSELQGGNTMEKRRITQKTRRFNAGIAATAAAILIIPAATVGVMHFSLSGNGGGDKFGAAVDETTAVTTTLAAEASTEALTEAQTDIMEHEKAVASQREEERKKYLIDEKRDDFDSTEQYQVVYNNIPENLKRDPDGFKFGYYINGERQTGGITPTLAHYNTAQKWEDYLDFKFNRDGNYRSARVEDYVLGEGDNERHVYISYRQEGPHEPEFDGDWCVSEDDWARCSASGYFNRDVVIRFADSDYIVSLAVHNTVPDEELRYFIEGVELKDKSQTESNAQDVYYTLTLSETSNDALGASANSAMANAVVDNFSLDMYMADNTEEYDQSIADRTAAIEKSGAKYTIYDDPVIENKSIYIAVRDDKPVEIMIGYKEYGVYAILSPQKEISIEEAKKIAEEAVIEKTTKPSDIAEALNSGN